MAVVPIPNFNRIINLYFLNKAGIVIKAIKCPEYGRKPDIEINGTFTAASEIPAFNVVVKNLYLDLATDQYAYLKVEAGYQDKKITISGEILSIFPEQPGPEGQTRIQCQYGTLSAWLNTYIDIKYEAGTTLQEVMEYTAKKLGLKGAYLGPQAAALTLKNKLQYSGLAKNLIQKLQQEYAIEKLKIYERDNRLVAFDIGSKDNVQIKQIKYLSSLPQMNAGGADGAYYLSLTAPWMPDLKIGDQLEIPTWQYVKYFVTVNQATKTNRIQVTALQFHFGTVKNTNQMTVQGYRK